MSLEKKYAFTDKDTLPFGKHQGEKLGDVPAGYLLFLADSDNTKASVGIFLYVTNNREALEAEEKEKFFRDKNRGSSGRSERRKYAGDDDAF